jgi:hypothetical protein
MRRHAEHTADTWYILSAKYGLLCSDQVVATYEQTLNAMHKAERLASAERVQQSLLSLLSPRVEVAFLPEKRYRENVVPFLERYGFAVTVPMTGLPFGSQLRWLKEQNSGSHTHAGS